MIKIFEQYIDEGVVQKITPDLNRAQNLLEEVRRKKVLLKKQVSKLGITDENANDYVEYCYNIIMFAIRSKMFQEGYISSGHSAHEAEIAFSRKMGLTESEIRFLDRLRYFRNGILYYGKRFDAKYAEKIIKFALENTF